MNQPRNPSTRCDAVLALIDECLAEAAASGFGGDFASRSHHPSAARRHLTLVGS